MKIALVHELLTMRGGAENVLKILADMFPSAPIYTLLYDEKKLGDWFPKTRVRTSIVQPGFSSAFQSLNHHRYLRQFPEAVEAWDFSEFDLVLSTSSAFVHGIITNSAPKHLCYVHSPARYLWDRTHDVIADASEGVLGSLKKMYLERVFHTLRIWDSEAADRPDALLAASKTVQRRIEQYWRRKSTVVYPPIDDQWLEDEASEGRPGTNHEPGYFLVVSSLVRYKRIDLAIRACNALGKRLKIVGEGPDRARLQRCAGGTVEFLGRHETGTLRKIIRDAEATIFPGDEDFGLVPLESMACGTPVIAFRSGGALETVLEGRTGEFFNEPTSESLQNILRTFERRKYDVSTLRSQAKKFSREHFETAIMEAVAAM